MKRLPKPYWQSSDGAIVLYHGDCLELLPLIEKGSVDAVITDPPYGIGYVKGSGGGLGIYGKRNGIPKRNIEAIHGDDKPFDPLPLLRFANVLLWGADHYSERLPHGRFLAWDKLDGHHEWDSFSDVEFAWHNRRGASRIIRYVWKGLCQGAGEDKGAIREHPTQKPVAVMRWSIEQSGATEGQTILDPFAGSCTTGVAAIRTGRKCILIEKEKKYCAIGAKRLAEACCEGPGQFRFEPEGSLFP